VLGFSASVVVPPPRRVKRIPANFTPGPGCVFFWHSSETRRVSLRNELLNLCPKRADQKLPTEKSKSNSNKEMIESLFKGFFHRIIRIGNLLVEFPDEQRMRFGGYLSLSLALICRPLPINRRVLSLAVGTIPCCLVWSERRVIADACSATLERESSFTFSGSHIEPSAKA
jgi:hypothetical protein